MQIIYLMSLIASIAFCKPICPGPAGPGQYAIYKPSHQLSRCVDLKPGQNLRFKIRTNEYDTKQTTDTFLYKVNWGPNPFNSYSHSSNYDGGWTFYVNDKGNIQQDNGNELTALWGGYKRLQYSGSWFLGAEYDSLWFHDYSWKYPENLKFNVTDHDGGFIMTFNEKDTAGKNIVFSNGPEETIKYDSRKQGEREFHFLLYEAQ